jgi:hypothetical protein
MLKEYAFTLHRQEKTLQVHGGWQPGTDRLYKPNHYEKSKFYKEIMCFM